MNLTECRLVVAELRVTMFHEVIILLILLVIVQRLNQRKSLSAFFFNFEQMIALKLKYIFFSNFKFLKRYDGNRFI